VFPMGGGVMYDTSLLLYIILYCVMYHSVYHVTLSIVCIVYFTPHIYLPESFLFFVAL
jgi:hypothetical protein